jgi:hypothetical protein
LFIHFLGSNSSGFFHKEVKITMKESRDFWWGDYILTENTTAQWEIGPLRFSVQRLLSEWLVANEQIESTENDSAWEFSTWFILYLKKRRNWLTN